MNIWTCIDHLFCPICLSCGARAITGANLCRGCVRDLPAMPPACCTVCARPHTGAAICGRCLLHPPPYSRAVAALLYSGVSIHLVHAFKFRGDLAAGAALAGLLRDAVRAEPDPDVLIPVPLSPARRRQRGFDQSLELARPVARTRAIPLLVRGVRRTRNSAPQSTLGGWDARWRNVCDVFHVKPGSVHGLRVAVVDDVMTSGATAQSLSRALLAAGARSVHLWVACRAGVEHAG